MYRTRHKDQMSLFDDNKRFVVNLDPKNRWMKLADIIPWDKIEDHYVKSLCEDEGAPAISSRIAFGSIYAKEALNLTDVGILEQIGENAYLQYFLGLEDYRSEPLFDSSTMVHFRKRFTSEFIAKVNEYICLGKWPEDDKNNDDNSGNHDEITLPESVENKGKLILDATAAPSDIRYPNDVMLLDECRENLERMIDELWEECDEKPKGKKTPYNRHNAHKKTINFIKKKKRNKAAVNAGLSAQLNYVELAMSQVLLLLSLCGSDALDHGKMKVFDTIKEIYNQQKYMFDTGTNRCDGKIMSLRQPFVRAICRNKARAKYEYGQKLALSKANGWVFVERQSWDNFNECTTLQRSVLDYCRRFGCFPKVILADQAYHTRDNMKFCKEQGIRLSGNGKTAKNADQIAKEQAYKDICERNEIEGVNGVLKRTHGLDLIMCWCKHNAEIEASLQILALNLRRRLRVLCTFLRLGIFVWVRRREMRVIQ